MELHTLLDDGEPHCSCGKSFRGKHYNFYTDHVIEELRTALTAVTDTDEAVERAARAAQHWAEYETVHLTGHVPMTWDEDDPEWWTGLAQTCLAAAGGGEVGRLRAVADAAGQRHRWQTYSPNGDVYRNPVSGKRLCFCNTQECPVAIALAALHPTGRGSRD